MTTPGSGNGELDRYAALRERMVREQIEARGVRDPRVLQAMREVPRHLFVLEHLRASAYEDGPLPIGYGQTISQPYIVALMTELARVAPGARVLDVGTGSGYQAAVLAQMGAEVYTTEIIAELAEAARKRLRALGYDDVHVRVADGSLGWPEHAPYQAIVVAAAPARVPRALLDQLDVGGRLVLPVGRRIQELNVYERMPDGTFRRTSAGPVRFVPLVGRAAWGDSDDEEAEP